MSDGNSIAIVLLGLLGGAALGAALGGLVAGIAKWRGAALAAALAVAGVIGALGGLFAIGGVSVPDVGAMIARAGESRQERRLMAVLRAHYPDDYAAASATLASLHASHAKATEVEAAMSSIGLPLIRRQLPLADTRSAIALLQLSRAQQRSLARDPQLCFRAMMQPGPDTIQEVEAATPSDLRARAGDVAVDLLEQTALRPKPSQPSEETDRKARIWVMDGFGGLSFQERELLKTMSSTPTDEQAAAVCHVYANVLDIMLFASPDDAAEVYKTVTAKGMSRLTN